MERKTVTKLFFLIGASAFVALSSCGEGGGQPLQPSQSSGGSGTRYGLYVASGACYGGGVTTSAGSGTIAVLDPDTGNLRRIIIDYGSTSPGDLPVAMADYNEDYILVAVENAAGRRLDLVRKDGSGLTTYLTNATALNGVLRAMSLASDGSVLVAKSTAIEKFAPSKARVTQGANPYVNAPGGACATATTLMVDVKTVSNGKILFAHAAATPNNKIGLVSASGYSVLGDCLTTQAAPATTALPTAILPHSSGKILVSYGSTTTASNSIQAYDLNITTNVFSGATVAFSDVAIQNGVSALTENPVDGSVYAANATSTFNTIERYSFDPATKLLTRMGPTIGPQYFTKCVASMKLFEDP